MAWPAPVAAGAAVQQFKSTPQGFGCPCRPLRIAHRGAQELASHLRQDQPNFHVNRWLIWEHAAVSTTESSCACEPRSPATRDSLIGAGGPVVWSIFEVPPPPSVARAARSVVLKAPLQSSTDFLCNNDTVVTALDLNPNRRSGLALVCAVGLLLLRAVKNANTLLQAPGTHRAVYSVLGPPARVCELPAFQRGLFPLQGITLEVSCICGGSVLPPAQKKYCWRELLGGT